MTLPCQHEEDDSSTYDRLSRAHILSGIEFVKLEAQHQLGFEGNNHALDDPRVALYAAAYNRSVEQYKPDSELTNKSIPASISKAVKEGNASLLEAVRTVLAKRIANLMLLPPERLQPATRVAEFGPNSMLAAEFRNFTYHALEVDIPFLAFLDANVTLNGLTETVIKQLGARG